MWQRATSLGSRCYSTAGRPYFEIASLQSINDELGLPNEQWGPPLLKMTLLNHRALEDTMDYRGLVLDEVLESQSLLNRYRTTKPFEPGCPVQRVAGAAGKNRPKGFACSAEDDGFVQVLLNGEREETRLPTAELVTGTPVILFQQGSLAKYLPDLVSWAWPEHLKGGAGITVLLDNKPVGTRQDVNCLLKGPAKVNESEMVDKKSYVLSRTQIQVNEQLLPVYIHPNDVFKPSHMPAVVDFVYKLLTGLIWIAALPSILVILWAFSLIFTDGKGSENLGKEDGRA